ncbi:MAG: type II toxin-antitoxin system RelE/ParE family toxin [Planctomycetaceae bacterium]|nr:type II toxin-antitoxin system RelE/ParE family toxin [Planctomycetaceae bacterium]
MRAQHRDIAQQSPEIADRWFNRFVAAIESLAHHPERCPIARESAQLGREIRQLLFGQRGGVRRVYFVIVSDEVHVLCVRHAAQTDITAEDLLDE